MPSLAKPRAPSRLTLRAIAGGVLLMLASALSAQARSHDGVPEALQSALDEVTPTRCMTPAAERPGRGAGSRSACSDANDLRVRQALSRLYPLGRGALLWSEDGRPTVSAVAVLWQLKSADAYGLRSEDYARVPVREPGPLTGDDELHDRAEFDVHLSEAVLRFVADLHYGRVDPRQAGFELASARKTLDLAAVARRLASTTDVARVVESVEPQFYHYRLLEEALAHYRALASQPDLTRLPPLTHRLELGDAYCGAAALRRLLAAVGDLRAASASSSAQTLDEALVEALRRFQARHGLEADGVLGRATFAALTTPLAHRVRQIELTLERWRWLPTFDSPPIIVNIPEFRLFAFRSTADRKADILQMDVIVGQTFPKLRTPIFAADLRYVIFRPYWDVPSSITRREILPALRADPGYLAAQHFEIVSGASDAAQPLPATPGNLRALAEGRLRVRQRPGPDNALGLIKFVLPNPYDVYLHSTPAHRLFGESRRAFSHGCVRVSDPVALAEQVLRNARGHWTREAIEAAMNGSTTQRVSLVSPIHVFILYGTVLASESGDVLFFEDLYGEDRKLERLLGLAPAI